jgi:hypothetical protein
MITALLSMPHLTHSENMYCAIKALLPLGIDVVRAYGPFWEQSMSALLEARINAGDEYVITLDYDSVFCAGDVQALLSIMRNRPDIDAVFPVQCKRNSNETMENVHPDAIAMGEASMDRPLVRCLSGHFGLTVFRCASFAKIPQPWLWSKPNDDGQWGEERGSYNADTAFWLAANHYGWKAYQANRVRIGHFQYIVSWPGPNGTVHQYWPDYDRFGSPLNTFPEMRAAGNGLPPRRPQGSLIPEEPLCASV